MTVTEAVANLVSSLHPYSETGLTEAITCLEKESSDSIADAVNDNNSLSAGISDVIITAHELNGATPLLNWMYTLMMGENKRLKLFVMSFIPVLLWTYLTRSLVSLPSPGINVLLLSMVKQCTRSSPSHSVWSVDVSLPDLAVGSLYHEPTMTPAQKSLTASVLRDHNRHLQGVDGEAKQGAEESFDTKNHIAPQVALVGTIISMFVASIETMPEASQQKFCAIIAWFCGAKADNIENAISNMVWKWNWSASIPSKKKHIRQPVVTKFEADFLRALTYSLFKNSVRPIALVALHALHEQASSEMNANTLLGTSALLEIILEE